MNSADIASRKAFKFGRWQVCMLGAVICFSAVPNFVCGRAAAQGAAQSTAPSAQTKKPAKAPAKRRTRKKTGPRAQTAPTPDRIREIQGALAKAGAYTGEPTGKWDAPTVEAMKSFQASHGLSATGKIDARSLQKLDLASETAGLAPPRSAPAKSPAPPKSPQ